MELTPGTGIIYENPEFLDSEHWDFELSETSPCINSGNPNYLDSDGSISDIGANPYNNQYCFLSGDVNSDAVIVLEAPTDAEIGTEIEISLTVDDGTITSDESLGEDIFISEYCEHPDNSNARYFEIYNPTSDTVDLTNYAFARVSNSPGNGAGVYEYWVDFDSAAIILPNDVYVVVHPSSDPFILAEAEGLSAHAKSLIKRRK